MIKLEPLDFDSSSVTVVTEDFGLSFITGSCYQFSLPPSPFVHQIEFVTNGTLPSDLSPALVVGRTELKRLQERTKELQVEIKEQKSLHHHEHQQHVRLINNHKDMHNKIQGKIHTSSHLVRKGFELLYTTVEISNNV